jgi:hypothetical protein
MRGGPRSANAGEGPPSLGPIPLVSSIRLCSAAVVMTFWMAASPAAPAAPSSDAVSPSPATRLVTQASQLALARNPEWLEILYYEVEGAGFRQAFPKSEITNQTFFLSPNGKRDANAELIATLQGLLVPLPVDADQHVLCRYPARANWLIEHLPGLEAALPEPSCPAQHRWSKGGEIRSISLVFASGYFANPASFFGHLLLKFNRDETSTAESLLDPSLSYGAIVPERENGLLYVTRGLFGGYQAAFTHESFYQYDHLYADEQLRDLWEYELDLSPDEVERIVMQSWELLGSRFDYRFLSRNCATQMARLLESVVDAPLLEARPWDIPVTIFHRLASIERNGQPLVRKIRHLPSRQRRLHSRFAGLSARERVVVRAFAQAHPDFTDERYRTLPEESRTVVSETLMDYYAFRLAGAPSTGPFERDRLAALRERFRLPGGGARSAPSPSDAPPHQAQPPGLLRISPFYNQERGAGVELQLRAAYFDLLSLDAGRPSESALSMLDLRLGLSEERVWLRNFDFVSLETWNLSRTGLPGDGGRAWSLAFGAGEADLKCDDCTLFHLKAGIGHARAFDARGRISGLAMLDVRLQSPRLETRTKSSEIFAVAPRLGLLGKLTSWWQTSLSASYRVYLDGRDSGRPVLHLENRLGGNRRWDIRLSYARDGAHEGQAGVSWYW